jgi:glyoxylase-like metal-dependent hydrolase (beta-lactamase superfamily II)
MILRQFLHTTPAVAVSYLVGCGGQGASAVVDPLGDVDPYLHASDEHGMTIRYVIDTHVHADHLSVGRSLAEASGAQYVLGPGVEPAFPVTTVGDGEELELGNVLLRVMHTPGHTPEHISLIVIDRVRGPDPWCVFTGHTLMIGDMGRTELATSAADGARDLFESARSLRELPDYVSVLPGAFSGSVCGRGLSGSPVSSIGFERRYNHAFGIEDPERFVEHMLLDIPEPPPHAADTRAANLGADVHSA